MEWVLNVLMMHSFSFPFEDYDTFFGTHGGVHSVI